MSPDEVTAHVLARAALHYSRASGPGGQHRDHTASRAELIVSADDLDGLPADVAARIEAALRLRRRPLRLASQADRSRERNRAAVERALAARIADALTPRRTRRATRPSQASVARRLDQKARRARTKAMRRPPGGEV